MLELNSAEFEAQGTISRRANALGEMAAARFSQLSLNELIKMQFLAAKIPALKEDMNNLESVKSQLLD